MLCFIFLCNIPGIIPVLQMPATARIAIPLALSLLVWVVFIGTGIKHQGIGYFGRGTVDGHTDAWSLEWQCL